MVTVAGSMFEASSRMRSTAVPSEMPGRSANETFTAGSWPE